ncbi:hypothetical protein CEXT_388131 [Caerostris extrusa]|uniref:Uncharacterized protein n=1 Tax=Caerostris extrusa TaxID=172846 RepID=A0AAV4NQM3_CAEEX|nr:hypothetical protein CEXT_388131 [Caerostris extrusa]
MRVVANKGFVGVTIKKLPPHRVAPWLMIYYVPFKKHYHTGHLRKNPLEKYLVASSSPAGSCFFFPSDDNTSVQCHCCMFFLPSRLSGLEFHGRSGLEFLLGALARAGRQLHNLPLSTFFLPFRG